jgi:hypothetical protein
MADSITAQPAPPPGYIDPEHSGADRELLEVFYAACNSEGGTADEIHLRGIRAVLAAQPAPPAEEEVSELAQWLRKHYEYALELGRPDWAEKSARSADLLQQGQSALHRLHRLQQENAQFREPERTLLCDLLANGTLLPDPDGKRYGVQPADGEVATIAARLKELAHAVTEERWREFSMRVPAEPLRDADLVMSRAAALLQHHQPPQPVAVSERLPGPEDCDAEGCIWLWDTDRRWVRQCRDAAASNSWIGSSWLPGYALPLPTPPEAGL